MNLELHLAQLQQPPAIALIASVLMLAAGYGIGVLATLPFPAIRRSVLRALCAEQLPVRDRLPAFDTSRHRWSFLLSLSLCQLMLV